MSELILQFGVSGSFAVVGDDHEMMDGLAKLTEYEQEVAFLIVLNWRFNKIAAFMNHFRLREKPRSADSMIKIKNVLCSKLNLLVPVWPICGVVWCIMVFIARFPVLCWFTWLAARRFERGSAS